MIPASNGDYEFWLREEWKELKKRVAEAMLRNPNKSPAEIAAITGYEREYVLDAIEEIKA
jgi:hypothetical protein